ncbi:hypothetical protein CEXT_217571 [Caerostris extrusa]|uniref:Uncharacterized protein n=1 Tax=Caerostris extrusa TaxID=172846 RepID=A0AAV4VNL0_CAEEX|nr:hypothetical protein CEXT_217571 [Caerostris extrusa]
MNRRYRPYHRRLASSGGGLSAPLVTGKLMTRNICGTYGNGGVGGGLPTDRNFVEHLGLGSFRLARKWFLIRIRGAEEKKTLALSSHGSDFLHIVGTCENYKIEK